MLCPQIHHYALVIDVVLFMSAILLSFKCSAMALLTLYLQDGSSFSGRSFGAIKDVTGEVGKIEVLFLQKNIGCTLKWGCRIWINNPIDKGHWESLQRYQFGQLDLKVINLLFDATVGAAWYLIWTNYCFHVFLIKFL